MRLSVIVAASDGGVIGRGGRLPWHLAGDLRRFRRLTTGHAIIMGRRTYESIGRPLPRRRMIVVSRNPDYQARHADVAGSLDEALRLAAGDEEVGDEEVGDDEVFVIGGVELFREALPLADRLYLTRVHADVAGDVYLPPLDLGQWQLREESRHLADESNDHDHTFLVYDRRST